MSTKGIYSAVSGAIAQDLRLQTIANNLANVNTTGFKKDGQAFREYLTAHEKAPEVLQVPRVPASIESFYNMQGADKSYAEANGTYTNFAQGSLRPTGNPLDIALEGSGFLEVSTPQGIRYLRAGALNLDANGRLITKDGHPVLAAGAPGSPPEGRQIILQGSNNVVVSSLGEIYQNGQQVGRLSVVDFESKDALQKVGHSYWSPRPNFAANPLPAPGARFHQGFLESSNVNVISEMTDMIATTRAFESLQKAIQAYDSMNDKLVNQVPKF